MAVGRCFVSLTRTLANTVIGSKTQKDLLLSVESFFIFQTFLFSCVPGNHGYAKER